MSLETLAQKIEYDLSMINYPPKPWRFEDEGIVDVAIIGAGMAGLTAAFALLKLGVSKIKIFDENEEGKEGPWITYARMVTLRSPKQVMGPALGIPSLTFQSWFEAQHGSSAWEDLGKIPRQKWMEYLIWFRKVLKLPVQNETKLLSIAPLDSHIKLHLSNETVLTHKVVLATGRSGYGGPEIPDFIRKIPKSRWAHTNELIDFASLKEKSVAIVGGGDAGFDAARIALEHHAKSADLFIRRSRLPNTNPARELFFPGCLLGYSSLTDEEKWKIVSHVFDRGTTPPRETLEGISKYPNFHFHANVDAEKILDQYDYIILGTGLAVDVTKQPELKPFMNDILLWKDKGFNDHPQMAHFPYLGRHFEFLEKKKGSAPRLKDIYCFNYGSYLSLESLGTEIPTIPFGAERLANGIATDFFVKNSQRHIEKLKKYNDPEYRYEEFSFFTSEI